MASRITSAASTADEYYYNQTVTPTDAATHTGQLERDADEYFPLQPIEKKLCAYSLGSVSNTQLTQPTNSRLYISVVAV